MYQPVDSIAVGSAMGTDEANLFICQFDSLYHDKPFYFRHEEHDMVKAQQVLEIQWNTNTSLML